MDMHEDQLEMDEARLRRLLSEQFPEWRSLPIHLVVSQGTENAIFRLGDDLAARFPLRAKPVDRATAEFAREERAMRELAACSPFPAPIRLGTGVPGEGYPMPWSVQSWLDGETVTPHGLADSAAFASDLATLISALRSAETGGRSFDGFGRGGELQDSDEWLERCFQESRDLLPVARLRAFWEECRPLPRSGADVMSHRDLMPGNLLVRDGRLVGVLDSGGFGPADPALDLVIAWHALDAEVRAVLRSALSVGELEWRRGAAWAFQQAMGLVWYYRLSNPGMSALGRTTLARIMQEFEYV